MTDFLLMMCLLQLGILSAIALVIARRLPNRQFVHLESPEDYPTREGWRKAQVDAAELMLHAGVTITLTEWISLSPQAQQDIFIAAVDHTAVDRMVAITDAQKPEDALANLSQQIEEIVPGATARWMAADAQAEGRLESAKRRAGVS